MSFSIPMSDMAQEWAILLSGSRRCFVTISLMLFGILLGFPRASAADLEEVRDANLAEILAQVTVIKQIRTSSSYGIRILRTEEPGECDPHNEGVTCPRSRLWIVGGLDTEGILKPRLWRTDRRIAWGVGDFYELPADIDGFAPTIIYVGNCEAPPDVESGRLDPRVGGWWVSVSYKLEVTAKGISISREPADGPGPKCPLY